MTGRKLGPNAKKLLARFAARVAIPPGGGIAEGIEAIKNIGDVTRKALALMDQAIEALRVAPDNPYGQDEEAICKAILTELENGERSKKNA